MLHELKPQWIDTERGVQTLAEVCARSGVFALDTEADSLHSYFHKVCLIQVTVENQHALIDPLALEAQGLKPLLRVVADPQTTVIMHGADYDIRVLDRDFDARIRGLLDTQIMAQMLGEAKTGLAALLENEFTIVLDKKYQRADWGRRPLSPAMSAYAAADTAFLSDLVARLRERLHALGRWAWAKEDCARLEEVRYVPPTADPLAFERIKGVSALKGSARDRAYGLWCWREAQARRRNLPPFKVLGNQPLLEMAIEPPQTPGEMVRMRGVGERFVRHSGPDVTALLRQPEGAPRKAGRRKASGPDANTRLLIKKILRARDEVAHDLALEPGLVCPKGTVVSLAEGAEPAASLSQLEARGLTGWRLQALGEPFLRALSE